MKNILPFIFYEESRGPLPKESIIVLVIFFGLLLITIGLGVLLLYKNKKAAKEAEIINKKKNLDNDEE